MSTSKSAAKSRITRAAGASTLIAVHFSVAIRKRAYRRCQ